MNWTTGAGLSTIGGMSSVLQIEEIVIVGVGLIGGSIALAVKERGLSPRVTGVGRDPQRLEEARRRGIIDRYITDPTELRGSGLAIVCTPVDRIATDVRALLDVHDSNLLVTDAGSVKGRICEEVSLHRGAAGRFVGSHPLAGSHRTGFESAQASLFEGRHCVVTPTETTDSAVTSRIQQFWLELGMQVREMSPAEHDAVLAVTSHLPHLAAAAVASQIDQRSVELASTGFRDTTRVAAGDPALWTAIFTQNADELLRATDRLIVELEQFRQALSSSDGELLHRLLAEARECRHLFDQFHT